MNGTVQSHVIVFVGMSLDGYIARTDGSLDFLDVPDVNPEADDHGFGALMARTDALLMGRTTYDKVMEFDVDWPYQVPVFVLTHRPIEPRTDGADVRTIAGEPDQVLQELAAQGFGTIYVDGGQTAQQFLAAGRVNEIILTRLPVLIGDGIPLFGALPQDIPLQHSETRSLPGGMVQSTYVVQP